MVETTQETDLVVTEPEKPKKTRREGPRSRLGCATCKARKVKCDLERPRCQTCTRRKLNCGGYSHVDASTFNNIIILPNRQAMPDIEYSASEHCMHSFVELLTYADTRVHYDLSFWFEEVMPASNYHPALWHGLCSFGAAWRYMISGSEEDRRVSYEQFGRALQTMKKIDYANLTNADKAVIVAVGLPFAYMNSTLGHVTAARLHIRSVLKMHDQWNREDPTGTHLPPAFRMVAGFYAMISGQYDTQPAGPIRQVPETQPPAVLFYPAFVTLQQAYFELEHQFSNVSKYAGLPIFTQPFSPSNPHARNFYVPNLVGWDEKWAEMIDAGTWSDEDRECLKLLRVRRLHALTILNAKASKGGGFGIAEFVELVGLSQGLIQNERKQGFPNAPTPFLSFPKCLREALEHTLLCLGPENSETKLTAINLLQELEERYGLQLINSRGHADAHFLQSAENWKRGRPRLMTLAWAVPESQQGERKTRQTSRVSEK